MDRVMSMVNGKRIDGHNIIVKKVNYGWSQMRHHPSSMVGPYKVEYLEKHSNISNPIFSKSIKDTRTYKEILEGLFPFQQDNQIVLPPIIGTSTPISFDIEVD